MRSFHRVTGLSLRVRGEALGRPEKEREVDPALLCLKTTQSRLRLNRMPPGLLPLGVLRHTQEEGGDPEVDPELAGGIIPPI